MQRDQSHECSEPKRPPLAFLPAAPSTLICRKAQHSYHGNQRTCLRTTGLREMGGPEGLQPADAQARTCRYTSPTVRLPEAGTRRSRQIQTTPLWKNLPRKRCTSARAGKTCPKVSGWHWALPSSPGNRRRALGRKDPRNLPRGPIRCSQCLAKKVGYGIQTSKGTYLRQSPWRMRGRTSGCVCRVK